MSFLPFITLFMIDLEPENSFVLLYVRYYGGFADRMVDAVPLVASKNYK